ncbi:Hydroxylase for synthesis of 2-methylthio-cis-ribozeatin in tRNA [Hahella chejuensis KCTC 2396]|uniref:Hydroxylase for synthesis of 2-methylthio-cis-ribozeatin in tRNA n=1 Tax=Hahella chejuensis (strain KCTC 2396) TaxID=349521 RepID=Q2SK44_HAHCH|nr:tRNA-(ms[2]io[6]A)-hydroxylase [Hahella chejuensis]ABC28980.1 Hydroxylase for synthesis of 2-methylthio-cis-ribozeatin in tRNA [Hahella chejuensis KCTC 2396]
MSVSAPEDIVSFLGCGTPEAWLRKAAAELPLLLVDHAQCEKKAASSALQLMFRYPEDIELSTRMSKLAREELRHYEQVVKIMQGRKVSDRKQTASRYASALRDCVRKSEPYRLVDMLIIGAFIEARSCERFARLIPYLDEELATFYRGLLESEGRHYRNYLKLAKERSPVDISDRVTYIREVEADLIRTPDSEFRFHSGIPA